MWHELKEYLRANIKPHTQNELIEGIKSFWATVNPLLTALYKFWAILPKNLKNHKNYLVRHRPLVFAIITLDIIAVADDAIKRALYRKKFQKVKSYSESVNFSVSKSVRRGFNPA